MNGSQAGSGAPGIDPGARGPGGMYVEESGTPGSPAILFIHGLGGALYDEVTDHLIGEYFGLSPPGIEFRRAYLYDADGKPLFRVLARDVDRLSLFIQLGALMAAQSGQLAPGNSLTVQTVSPRDAESWVILSEGEERLNLPIGEVMAFKLTRAPRRPVGGPGGRPDATHSTT